MKNLEAPTISRRSAAARPARPANPLLGRSLRQALVLALVAAACAGLARVVTPPFPAGSRAEAPRPAPEAARTSPPAPALPPAGPARGLPDPGEGGSGTRLSAEEALRWYEAGQPPVLWVDARPAAAYQRGHLPGALLLNEDEWSERFGVVLTRWTQAGQPLVVVYCDGGDCHASEEVAARLEDSGVSPTRVLAGGWPAWQRVNVGRPHVRTGVEP